MLQRRLFPFLICFFLAFSAKQLEPGFSVGEIQIPPIGVKINLIGHRFNKWLSANIHYMRPVGWVKYRNINGNNLEHSVWMNIAELSLKTELPLQKKISWYGEAGLGIIIRKGFKINNVWAVKDAVIQLVFLKLVFVFSAALCFF